MTAADTRPAPSAPDRRRVPVVSVIVPTYNESDNIGELIDRLGAVLADLPHEVIVVDDDSPDETWRVARERAADDPTIRVIRRFDDRGLSSAVLAGMAVAEGRTLAVIDADMQHDESVLPRMVDSVAGGEADICVGTRSGDGGSYGSWSKRRRATSWIAATLARRLLPLRTTDPMSGYFVVSREAFERVGPRINPRGFKILLEFLARGDELRVAEIGYTFRNRTRGETKLSGAVIRNYLVAVLDLRFGRWVSPVFLMYCLVGLSGVLVNLAGFGFGELIGLPRVDLSFTPELNPIYLSVLFGIQLSILTNFVGNNYFTFHEDRHRGFRGLLVGFVLFEAVSIVGVIVQAGVFQLLNNNEFPSSSMNDDLRATIDNAIGIGLATFTNFFLNTTITWNRPRGRRFTYG
ncbi:MAG: glycosyltransferase [Acidimicrobiales bacterium]